MLSFTLLAAATFAAPQASTPAPSPSAKTIGFLPRGLTSFGATSVDGWLYVLGGYFGTPHEYSIEGQSSTFMKINLHDPSDTRWIDDVEPVQGAELVAYGRRLVSVGGMHARNQAEDPADLVSSREVRVFDSVEGTWSKLPDLPAPRSSHRAVVAGDTLLVIGGWSLAGAGAARTWAQTYFTLDLASEGARWVEHGAPFATRALGAAVAGGSVYAIGGITPDRSVTSAVWVLDIDSGTWSEGPEFPDSGFGVTATEIAGGTALVASGKSGAVYRLNPTDAPATWAACAHLSHGRIFHEVVEDHEGDLVALGGIVGMGTRGRVRALERVEMGETLGSACASIDRLTVPAPCAARNRFGFFLEGRSVYLFGGNNSLGQHDFEPLNFTDEAWRLDLGSLKWSPIAPLPTRRQTLQTAVAQDGKRGFAVGGFGHNGEDAVTQSSTWTYDFEFDEWSDGPSLVGSRSQFGLASMDERLWVFGGLDYDPLRPDGLEFDHRLDVLRWDGEADSFHDTGIRIPEARRAFAGASLDGRYFMVGGMGANFALVPNAVAFDFASEEWSPVPAPSRPRVGADLVPCGGALYLVGGSSPRREGKGLESNASIERLDPVTMTWSTVVEDLAMEMKHARAIEVDGRLCILSMHRAGAPRLEIVYVDCPRVASAGQ